MKKITGYLNATVFDVEADGFLANATKIHVLSFHMAGGRKDSIRGDDHARLRSFFLWHRDEGIPLVAHNGICYDIPVVERLLDIDLSGLMVIDTLGLSWYLNTKRKSHGLDSFHEDYGIAKPKIDDWENLTYEEYKHRCDEDVKINKALYDDLCDRLNRMYSIAQRWVDRGNVGGSRFKDEMCYIDTLANRSVEQAVDAALTFLMYKMDTIRDREKARWKGDIKLLQETEKELSETLEQAREELHAVMPKVPKYVNVKKPTLIEKKDGSPSAAAVRWFKLCKAHNNKEVDEFGTRTAIGVDDIIIKRLKGYAEPNANSSDQIKNMLFSHGWKPETFKYVKDKEAMQAWADSGFKKALKPKPRAVPQITVEGDNGKELCQSVQLLIEKEPAIASYGRYTLIKHRLEMVTRFLNSMDDDGYLVAGVGGWTNTLRDKHKAPLTNLPGINKPYGKNIRGSLTCDEGEVLLGTDLSSLEDRVKHHFLLPIDPDYVATMMADDYDPHLSTAQASSLITEDEEAFYKWYKESH